MSPLRLLSLSVDGSPLKDSAASRRGAESPRARQACRRSLPLDAGKTKPRGSLVARSPRGYVPNIPEPAAVAEGADPWTVVSMMDKRAWLEVMDSRHRYAKNLRSYFQAWDLLGHPGSSSFFLDATPPSGSGCLVTAFFDWLDKPHHSDGRGCSPQPLFELEHCPRATLDRDIVHYCAPGEAAAFELRISAGSVLGARAVVRRAATSEPLETGSEGYIFVVRNGTFYAAPKRTTPPRFHHSSFFSGGAVQVAGILVTIEGGELAHILPHSGHYRPRDAHVRFLLKTLSQRFGVDLRSLQVDGQHVMKVARHHHAVAATTTVTTTTTSHQETRKVKKAEAPHLVRGDIILCFLEAKAMSMPLFDELIVSRKGRAVACSSEGGGQGGGEACDSHPVKAMPRHHRALTESEHKDRKGAAGAEDEAMSALEALEADAAAWAAESPPGRWFSGLDLA